MYFLSWEHLKIVGYFWYRNLSQDITASHCPPGCPFLPLDTVRAFCQCSRHRTSLVCSYRRPISRAVTELGVHMNFGFLQIFICLQSQLKKNNSQTSQSNNTKETTYLNNHPWERSTRNDASHLHSKPLQLQPMYGARVVRVPPLCPNREPGEDGLA